MQCEIKQMHSLVFLSATAVPAGTAEARISYGNFFWASWDRDSGSSLYDSLESLVSYEVIWCHWVRRFPSNEGITPLEIVILPLLAHLPWKRLQIDTDLLPIITSTADELSRGTNIDDLERRWTPKTGVFSEFSAILGCNTHFKVNCAKTIQDRPGQPAYEMFGIKRRFQKV